jgi:putative lipoprotein
MKKLRFVTLSTMLVLSFLSACSSGSDSVSGTITYLQRIALPDDAVITVQIQDTSLADAPATVMGEQVIQTEGKQVPFEFEVTYDAEAIQDNHSYTMSVRITDGTGNLLFINDTVIPVITRDNPTEEVEIIVVPVQ